MFLTRWQMVVALGVLAVLLCVSLFLTRPIVHYKNGVCVSAEIESPKNGIPLNVTCGSLTFIERIISGRREE